MTTPAPQPTPYYSAPAQQQKTNVLAIVSLVTSIIGMSLIGIITGHIALSQIKRTGENGRGLALAGTIIGYAGIVLSVILVLAFLPFILAGAAMSSY
ncbi:DUF4190 domain-containing protein [Ruicaihuangia caeni]|uniref:DUF4190 domain-containing protein n=1 Tax=Ruicaihuangia caeni TaxID=3042517 RepID=UPI00339041F4